MDQKTEGCPLCHQINQSAPQAHCAPLGIRRWYLHEHGRCLLKNQRHCARTASQSSASRCRAGLTYHPDEQSKPFDGNRQDYQYRKWQKRLKR